MPQQEFLIAHLSDLHLSPQYFPERSQLFRSALEQSLALNVDHIIISGDITNQAKENEYEEFRAILKEYKILDGKKVSVVIGNHDIYGGPYHAEDVLEFPAFCKKTDYEIKINEFHIHTKELFTNAKYLSETTIFPFVKNFGETVLIGLNSVALWSPLNNPLGSNGFVDDEQFELLKAYLQSPDVIGKQIYIMIHHHFQKVSSKTPRTKLERLWYAIEDATMKMRKKKRLLKLFKANNVQGVFHGHVHCSEEYHRKTIRCFNAGGSIIPSRHAQRMLNIFALSNEGLSATMLPVLPPSITQTKRFAKSKMALAKVA